MIHQLVEERDELAREELWHETCVVGARARFNHLDGEIQLLREPLTPSYFYAASPKDLPKAGVWLLAGLPAAACVVHGGTRDQWPNLWSLRHWKEKMERPARHITRLIEACGGVHTCRCQFCPTAMVAADHLLGPKHYAQVVNALPTDGSPLSPDAYWQTFTFADGAVAFNHVDGTIRLIRRPREGEQVEASASTAGAPQKLHERLQSA